MQPPFVIWSPKNREWLMRLMTCNSEWWQDLTSARPTLYVSKEANLEQRRPQIKADMRQQLQFLQCFIFYVVRPPVRIWINKLFVWCSFFETMTPLSISSLWRGARGKYRPAALIETRGPASFLSSASPCPLARPRVRVSLSFWHKVYTPTMSLSIRSLVCNVVTKSFERSSILRAKHKARGLM